MTQQIWTSPHLIIAHSFITNYNGFPGGGEFSNQICPLHAYVAKALIHDGCRCFFVFCLTIKRLLFIETKPNITSYNLYYVNLRWEKERKERHDSLYSPSTRCNRSAVKSRKLNISRGAKLSIFCNSSLLHHLSPFSVSFSFFVICSIDNTVSDWIVT